MKKLAFLDFSIQTFLFSFFMLLMATNAVAGKPAWNRNDNDKLAYDETPLQDQSDMPFSSNLQPLQSKIDGFNWLEKDSESSFFNMSTHAAGDSFDIPYKPGAKKNSE